MYVKKGAAMIFAKDEISGNKRLLKKGVSTYNLIIASFCCALGIALVLAGAETWPAFLLLLCGAIWNFFCDFKKYVSLIFGFIVSVLYAHFAFLNGLYAHAYLHLLVYIPLQFMVCLKNFDKEDTGIIKDHYMTGSEKYYTLLVVLFVFTFSAILTAGIKEEVFGLLDTISAIMLGVSAYLRSYRYQEYFTVRYIAVGTACMLWVIVIATYGVAPGSLMIVLLFLMYLLSDIFGHNEWKRSYEWTVPAPVTKQEIKTAKKEEKIIEQKKQQYRNIKEAEVRNRENKKQTEKDPQIFA